MARGSGAGTAPAWRVVLGRAARLARRVVLGLWATAPDRLGRWATTPYEASGRDPIPDAQRGGRVRPMRPCPFRGVFGLAGGEVAGEDVTVRGDRLIMPPRAGLGQHHVDTPAVQVTGAALDEAGLREPVHQARQRALAQVHRVGQVLGARLALRALGQPVEHLEVADAQAVPIA